MSRDRRIITRNNKLTVAALAGTLTVVTMASAATASAATAGPAIPGAEGHPAASGSPESVAQSMLASFGWASSQFSCLEPLWQHESGWNVTATNPSTGPALVIFDPGSACGMP